MGVWCVLLYLVRYFSSLYHCSMVFLRRFLFAIIETSLIMTLLMNSSSCHLLGQGDGMASTLTLQLLQFRCLFVTSDWICWIDIMKVNRFHFNLTLTCLSNVIECTTIRMVVIYGLIGKVLKLIHQGIKTKCAVDESTFVVGIISGILTRHASVNLISDINLFLFETVRSLSQVWTFD